MTRKETSRSNEPAHYVEPWRHLRHLGDGAIQSHTQEAASSDPKPISGSLEVVWQWICYSLWEATFIVLTALLTATFAYYFENSNRGDYSFVAYLLAAGFCLLPATFVTDMIYSRKEPRQKRGFAAVVFVLNALAVFVVSMAAFMTFVISIVTLAVSNSASSSRPIVIVASALVAIFGGLLFMRLIDLPRLAKFNFNKLFTFVTLSIAVLAMLFAVVGPFASAVGSRQDRFVEANAPSLSGDVQTYLTAHNKLPSDLRALNPSDQNEQQLIDKRLVTYRGISSVPASQYGGQSYTTGIYEICAFYQKAKGSDPNAGPSNSKNATYIDTGSHPAGWVCYRQRY